MRFRACWETAMNAVWRGVVGVWGLVLVRDGRRVVVKCLFGALLTFCVVFIRWCWGYV